MADREDNIFNSFVCGYILSAVIMLFSYLYSIDNNKFFDHVLIDTFMGSIFFGLIFNIIASLTGIKNGLIFGLTYFSCTTLVLGIYQGFLTGFVVGITDAFLLSFICFGVLNLVLLFLYFFIKFIKFLIKEGINGLIDWYKGF